jgi:ATP-dependent Lhr-like helicase
LLRALLDGHPAGRLTEYGIGKAARPFLPYGGGRGDDDTAFQFVLGQAFDLAKIAEIDAEVAVGFAKAHHASVQIDGVFVSCLPQLGNDTLCFSKRVSGDQMATLRFGFNGIQKFLYFPFHIGMGKDGEGEGCLGYDQVARDGFKRRAGGIALAFVIARDDGAAAVMFQQNLCAAEDMSGGVERDANAVDVEAFPILHRLKRGSAILAVAFLHDFDGFTGRQHVAVPGAGVVGMAVRNKRPFLRSRGVDKCLDRFYIKVMAQKGHSKIYKAADGPLPEGLAELPLTGWMQERGWDYHTHQLEVLKGFQEGKDVLLTAPTGGGKTLSGFLPVFMNLHQRGYDFKGLHTVYISPLKALAADIHRNLEKPIDDLKLAIRHETRTGDTPSHKRARQKAKPPHILLTTPESLALLLSYPEAAEMFANLKAIIIDEIHALMHSKRGDLLSLNLSVLESLAPDAQRIGLSATVADPEEALSWLSRRKRVLVEARAGATPEVKILLGLGRMPWSGHMATYALPEVYAEIVKAGKSVVFVNTRAQAELMFQGLWKINDKNLKIAVHHGSLEPAIRRKVESMMAQGALDCVVATSSLDLGLDWADVSLVVQIGAPKGVSRLLQRVGRSNHRMDEPSRAILVPANRFEYLECLAAQKAIMQRTMDGMPPKKGSLDVLAQHIIGQGCRAPFDPDQVYAQTLRAYPYHDLPRETFDKVLAFTVNGGYALRGYDRFHRLIVNEDGLYQIANKKFVQLYRMNIGTIVESPMLKIKLKQRTLGTIEESFIQNMSKGDTFLFAGEVLRYESIHDMNVMVSRTKDDTAKIPSYAGGKMPLSSHLSEIVRGMLYHRTEWDDYPERVSEWLFHQQEQSVMPKPDHLLVETFPRQGRYYMVAYPFEGRAAHQTMGFLLMRRLQRIGARPMGFVASDYGIALWSFKPITDMEWLFREDMLGDDLEEWLKETPLLKRMFRDSAVISGLVERSYPGQRKTGKQMTFSTDLIYDVLQKYEPDHILLQAAYQDAAGGLIDLQRLSTMLERIQGKIDHHRLEKVSPLAVPLILEISRESMVRKELNEYAMEDFEETLLEEAGLS